jgi:hypothetical protein
VEYIFAVKILQNNKKAILKKDMFMFNEIEGNLVDIVAELFKEFSTDDDSFEHDTTGANLAEKDEVGIALSGVDFLVQKFNFFIKEEVLFFKVDKLASLIRIFKCRKLIL